MSLTTALIPARDPLSRKLMLVLHGLGDSMEGYRWLPPALDLPEMNYLLVNAPDAYYGGFSWYDIYGNAGPGIHRSCQELAELLDTTAAHSFPTALTTVLGFSQGCLLTIELAGRHPKRFAGLVGISGYVSDPEALTGQLSPVACEQRILFTHGAQDNMVSCQAVEQQVGLLRRAGLQIEWKVFNKGHTIAGDEEIRLIRSFVKAGYADG